MQQIADSLKVDLIIADPPYNIGYEYDIYNDNRPDEEYLDWTYRWISAAHRLLKDDGSIWIAIGDEYAAEVKYIAQRKVGLHLRNWVIWYYTFGVSCQDKFCRSHTHLLYFVKDPKSFKFRAERIRVPSARRLVYDDARTNPAGRVPDNTWILRPQDIPNCFQPIEDTWYFARVAGTFRERAKFMQCQLPEKLLARIILSCSDPGDIVFDPFVGSGSSLVVAKKLGRRWFGCELSPNYARHAQQRLDLAQVGDPLEGPDDPLLSSPSTPCYLNIEGPNQRQGDYDEQLLIQCFLNVNDGFSVDRLLADPVLSVRFIDACSQAGLPGRPVDWNLALLRLRKQKELRSGCTKRTRLPRQDLEPILFGAEIALRKLLDQGYPSLDYILADPAASIRFDDLARRLAPGRPTWHYRWAALHLRKRAHSKLPSILNAYQEANTILSGNLVLLEPGIESAINEEPSLYYVVQKPGARREPIVVYIGASKYIKPTVVNLVKSRDHLAALCRRPGDLFVKLVPAGSKMSNRELEAFRYAEVQRLRPELNYLAKQSP